MFLNLFQLRSGFVAVGAVVLCLAMATVGYQAFPGTPQDLAEKGTYFNAGALPVFSGSCSYSCGDGPFLNDQLLQ